MTSLFGPIFRCGVETLVSNREARTASNEKLDSIPVAIHRGPVQCRTTEDTFRSSQGAVVQQVHNCFRVTVPRSRIHRIRYDVTSYVSRIDGPMIVRRIWSATSPMSGEIGTRRNNRLNVFELPECGGND